MTETIYRNYALFAFLAWVDAMRAGSFPKRVFASAHEIGIRKLVCASCSRKHVKGPSTVARLETSPAHFSCQPFSSATPTSPAECCLTLLKPTSHQHVSFQGQKYQVALGNFPRVPSQPQKQSRLFFFTSSLNSSFFLRQVRLPAAIVTHPSAKIMLSKRSHHGTVRVCLDLGNSAETACVEAPSRVRMRLDLGDHEGQYALAGAAARICKEAPARTSQSLTYESSYAKNASPAAARTSP